MSSSRYLRGLQIILFFALLSCARGPKNETSSSPDTDPSPDSTPAQNDTVDGKTTGKPLKIEWMQPRPDASVTNPVQFKWSVNDAVQQLRLVDENSDVLWRVDAPSTVTSKEYDFGPEGFNGQLTLHALGTDDRSKKVTRTLAVRPRNEREKGTDEGKFAISYYYLARESNYTTGSGATLYDADCEPMEKVSVEFAESVCIEGSGKLNDGTVINYAETCDCGHPCPTGGTICYQKLDSGEFPWGRGARNNPLKPFRSIAVDPDMIELLQWVYIPAFDGVDVNTSIRVFEHDGCFRTDDVGGAIQDRRIDIFSGTKSAYHKLDQIHGTLDELKMYTDSPRCWRHKK